MYDEASVSAETFFLLVVLQYSTFAPRSLRHGHRGAKLATENPLTPGIRSISSCLLVLRIMYSILVKSRSGIALACSTGSHIHIHTHFHTDHGTSLHTNQSDKSNRAARARPHGLRDTPDKQHKTRGVEAKLGRIRASPAHNVPVAETPLVHT